MAQLTTVRELQQRIARMQPLRSEADELPTPEELRPLLPEGALRRGGTISVQGSLQLALALVSAVSQAGAWCGAVGLPELGLEAAHRSGIALDRFVLVPDPGARALGVTSTLSEVLSAVLLGSPGRPTPGEVERVSAKLRDHGTALIVLGPWPRANCTLQVERSEWSGLGRGNGMLDARELNVRSEDRRGPRRHTVRLSGDRTAPLRRSPPVRLEAVTS